VKLLPAWCRSPKGAALDWDHLVDRHAALPASTPAVEAADELLEELAVGRYLEAEFLTPGVELVAVEPGTVQALVVVEVLDA